MKKYLLISLALVLTPILILVIEIFLAKNGEIEAFTNPSREPLIIGEGRDEITYIILGDSTSAGQGGEYINGIAIQTAKYLSQTTGKKVRLINFSISGATTEELRAEQLPKALEYKADFVLVSAGANDVTHAHSFGKVRKNIEEITAKLIEKNCDSKIIMTATPDMGSLPRLAQPLRSLVGIRADRQNKKVFYPFIEKSGFTLAPIANETGPIFRKDKSLFASDKYHPNDRGYQLWIEVINKSIDQSIKNQPSHCLE